MDPGSAAHHLVLRCVRGTQRQSQSSRADPGQKPVDPGGICAICAMWPAGYSSSGSEPPYEARRRTTRRKAALFAGRRDYAKSLIGNAGDGRQRRVVAVITNTEMSNRGDQEMSKYRVVTPKGASFTVAGGGYDYEKEALDPIGAEIVEAPANEAEFIAAAKNADAIYAKGMPITKTIIDAAGKLQGHHARQRRRRQRRREGRDRARHPRHQHPRHLHRGSRRPRHDAAAVRLSPPGRAGQDGARRAAGPRAGRRC